MLRWLFRPIMSPAGMICLGTILSAISNGAPVWAWLLIPVAALIVTFLEQWFDA